MSDLALAPYHIIRATEDADMDYGIVMFSTHYASRPDELARAVEARGFESLWFPEHTHIPASRRSPWPGGSNLPQEYWHSYDPFVALTMAAAVTTRIKLGTGICLVVERDPITTAKDRKSTRLNSSHLGISYAVLCVK